MATKTQAQIDRIHESKTATPGKVYIGPRGVRYVGSKKGHLIQEQYLRGDVNGTTLNSRIDTIGKYTVQELEELLEALQEQVEEEVSEEGDKHFKFEQGVPASTWVVQHNLGKKPSVMVVDSGDNEVEGCTNYIDDDNLEIVFSAPFSGTAYLN
jgi:hypothetical protein